MLTCATTPYRISGTDGGNSRPRLPEEVINPSEKSLEYFPVSINGYNRPPRSIMVTPDAPVNAVKNAQATRTAMGVPPGMPPK